MSEIFNFKVFELWDRFLSAGFLDMIQSLLAVRVVYSTMTNINDLNDFSNSELLKNQLGSEDQVIKLQSELQAAKIRVFIMIGGVALDVFFITFIQMVGFITSQKKMKCKALPCMRTSSKKAKLQAEHEHSEIFEKAFSKNYNMKAQNICIKYAFLSDLAIWVGLIGLAVEFKRFSLGLVDLVESINQPNISKELFELYINMHETVNSATDMFTQIALIYGLLLGILIFFIIWEILDYVFMNRFTSCFVKSFCFCCCLPEENTNNGNDFLDAVRSLDEFQDSFDQAIVMER